MQAFFLFQTLKKDQHSIKQILLESNNKKDTKIHIKIFLSNKVFLKCIHLQLLQIRIQLISK